MSNEPIDRLAAIREIAGQIMAAANDGFGVDFEMDAEFAQSETEAALQECHDLAARIRDLAGGGS